MGIAVVSREVPRREGYERNRHSLTSTITTGENVARESRSLSGQDVITGENVEGESGSLSEQDVNHGRECGRREWVTL